MLSPSPSSSAATSPSASSSTVSSAASRAASSTCARASSPPAAREPEADQIEAAQARAGDPRRERRAGAPRRAADRAPPARRPRRLRARPTAGARPRRRRGGRRRARRAPGRPARRELPAAARLHPRRDSVATSSRSSSRASRRRSSRRPSSERQRASFTVAVSSSETGARAARGRRSVTSTHMSAPIGPMTNGRRSRGTKTAIGAPRSAGVRAQQGSKQTVGQREGGDPVGAPHLQDSCAPRAAPATPSSRCAPRCRPPSASRRAPPPTPPRGPPSEEGKAGRLLAQAFDPRGPWRQLVEQLHQRDVRAPAELVPDLARPGHQDRHAPFARAQVEARRAAVDADLRHPEQRPAAARAGPGRQPRRLRQPRQRRRRLPRAGPLVGDRRRQLGGGGEAIERLLAERARDRRVDRSGSSGTMSRGRGAASSTWRRINWKGVSARNGSRPVAASNSSAPTL